MDREGLAARSGAALGAGVTPRGPALPQPPAGSGDAEAGPGDVTPRGSSGHSPVCCSHKRFPS